MEGCTEANKGDPLTGQLAELNSVFNEQRHCPGSGSLEAEPEIEILVHVIYGGLTPQGIPVNK